ncbi:MAG: DUF2130 domain-containing protein [Gemmatimonadaceae bacterium]
MQAQLTKLKAAEVRAKVRLRSAIEKARGATSRAKAQASRHLANEQRKAADRLRKHQNATKKMRAQIENLERRLKSGETAQSEGLLEERALLAFLSEKFPSDRFDHVGRGGDVLHDVCTSSGVKVGRIVYECKRVASWAAAHVVQCAEARVLREADIAILVTNRFPAKHQYYFVDRNVLVISPLALIPLVHTAREGLLNVHGLRVSGDQKRLAVQAVYDYLAGGQYADHIRRVVQHFTDLEILFHKEVESHRKTWEGRLKHYHGLANGVSTIDERLRQLLSPVESATSLPTGVRRLLPRFAASDAHK